MNQNYFASLSLLLLIALASCSNSSKLKTPTATSSNCEHEDYVDYLDLVSHQLKGNVKEVKSRSARWWGEELEILRFNEGGFLTGSEIWEKDRLKEVRVIKRDGLKRVVSDSTYKQSYDHHINKLRDPFWEVDANVFDEAGRIVNHKITRSDGQNNESVDRFNADGCIEFQSILRGSDGSFSEITYSFDEQKGVKETLEKRKDGDRITESRYVSYFDGDVLVKSEEFTNGTKDKEDIFVQTDSGQTQYIILLSEEGVRDTAHISKWNKEDERIEDIFVKEEGKYNRYEYFTEDNIFNLIQKNYWENELRSTMASKRNENDVRILYTEEYMGEEITREEWDELGNPIMSHKKGVNPFNGEKLADEILVEYTYERDQVGNWLRSTQKETVDGKTSPPIIKTREIIYW